MTTQDMTRACLVDRLKQHLVAIESEEEGRYDNRKYYNEAHDLLKIGTFRPVPHFQVSVSELLRELRVLDKWDGSFVLKQAVGRIFENVNFEIYHNSVCRVLKVKYNNE